MTNFNHYWPVYKNLEEEVLELSKFIQFDDYQLKIYSIHIVDLLVRTVIEIEAISKEMYWKNGGAKVYDDNGKERPPYFDTEFLKHLNDLWYICAKKVIVSCTSFYFEK